MPTWEMVAGEPTGTATGAGTFFMPVAGVLTGGSTGEARRQVKVYSSYTWANLYVRCTAFTAPTDPTVRSRIGAVNGNMVVTVTGTGVFEDTTNTDALVDQSLINHQIANAGGGSKTWTIIGSTLQDATTNETLEVAHAADAGSVAFGLTRFAVIAGSLKGAGGLFATTESTVQYTLRRATTYSNLRFLLYSNNMDADTTWRLRVDALDGNQVLTIAGGATGAFEDTTNSDVVAAGSEVNFEIDTTLSTTGNIFSTLSQMRHVSIGREMAAAASTVNTSTVDQYFVAEGNLDDTVTETNTQIAARAAFSARNLMVLVTTHGAGVSDVFLRVNTANSALTVSVPSSSTGAFEDTTNIVDIGLTDLYNFFLDTPVSIGITIIGMEQQPSAGGGRRGGPPSPRPPPRRGRGRGRGRGGRKVFWPVH